MADIDLRDSAFYGTDARAISAGACDLNGSHRFYKKIAFSALTGGKLANGDTLFLDEILPKGAYIQTPVCLNVLTEEGAADTIDVGLFTNVATPVAIDADGLADGLSVNTEGIVANSPDIDGDGAIVPAFGVGYLCTADSVVGITANADISAAVIEISFLWADLAMVPEA